MLKWNYVFAVISASILVNVANGRVVRDSSSAYPTKSFDPASDSAALLKAMKGWGTNETAIISILGNRSIEQRAAISRSFKTSYGKDLPNELESELSGKFGDLVETLMAPSATQLCANELHKAVDGLGTDEDAIIEILSFLSNKEMQEVARAYEKTFGNILEADLKGDTSGTFQKFCVSIVQGNRSEDQKVDKAAAVADAKALYQAASTGADTSIFHTILVTRSPSQLLEVLAQYKKITGLDLEETISKTFSGSTNPAYLSIIEWFKSPADYFAKRLYGAMNDSVFTTDYNSLNRIIVGRSEIDLPEIKKAFTSRYEKSLSSALKEAGVSGNYGKLLMLLVSN